MTTYGLGIDTGGTYTDTVVVDLSTGAVVCGNKALTTREDLAVGIRNSLLGLDRGILHEVSLTSLSSTLATNSVVENKGCRVGLICIGKEYDRRREPECYAEVDGRFSMKGETEVELDVQGAKAALNGMKGKVDALAISGYVSVRNPSHEDRVAAMAARILDVPVVRGHDLTSRLGFEQRTTTAVMNARLIPVIRELLESVRSVMDELGIASPLMMVKGDGALMKDSTTLIKPVETILSGPASSLTGAKALTGIDDAVMIDVGGTTSDIGVLKDGFPRVEPEGARLGGRRTRVMAADIATFGIGGDSRIVVNGRELVLSPVRAVPLCIAAGAWPSVKETLRSLEGACGDGVPDDCDLEDVLQDDEFLKLSHPQDRSMLKEADRLLLGLLEDGPMRVRDAADILGVPDSSFSVSLLESRGFVTRIGFTPTDLLHAEGSYTQYDAEASLIAARYLARTCRVPVEEFIASAKERVAARMASCIMEKILLDESGKDELDQSQSDLIDDVLYRRHGDYSLEFRLKDPLIGIGAPVGAWLPRVAEMLHAELILPEDYSIGNAIGAITGSVSETRTASVRSSQREPSDEPECNVYVGGAIREFGRPREAIEFAVREASRLAEEAAVANGCANPVIETDVKENWVSVTAEKKAFSGAEITARATGKPDLN